MRRMKFMALPGLLLCLSGCWNGENIHIALGDVSFGQQLIDLKSALDGGAMSQSEYDEAKANMLALLQESDDDDSDSDDDN